MTFQVQDLVMYRERPFNLIGIAGEGLFDPRLRGIDLPPDTTGCWRGFVSHYAVADDHLWLRDVDLCDGKFYEPEGRGILAWFQRREWRTKRESRHRVFAEDLAKPVPFTGGLLVEIDYEPGFWNSREVYELVFDRGSLVEARNRSGEMRPQVETAPEMASDPPSHAGTCSLQRYHVGLLHYALSSRDRPI